MPGTCGERFDCRRRRLAESALVGADHGMAFPVHRWLVLNNNSWLSNARRQPVSIARRRVACVARSAVNKR
ncbi:hypothetical protein [Accumulibacter sp.]|uniref:hypothetical protein n=1 Tax=Accumulibacter sp. TaxID=2053492 RepID=UPI00260B6FFD|nr:hypothetical protein [Accumulibacter sp.]